MFLSICYMAGTEQGTEGLLERGWKKRNRKRSRTLLGILCFEGAVKMRTVLSSLGKMLTMTWCHHTEGATDGSPSFGPETPSTYCPFLLPQIITINTSFFCSPLSWPRPPGIPAAHHSWGVTSSPWYLDSTWSICHTLQVAKHLPLNSVPVTKKPVSVPGPIWPMLSTVLKNTNNRYGISLPTAHNRQG